MSEEQLVTINLFLQTFTLNLIKPMYGIRDKNSLDSISQSLNQIVFDVELYPTIIDKAAQLWFSLINSHCFYNGNKRTALAATYVFLKQNGYQLLIDPSFYNFSLDIIEKALDRSDIQKYLKNKISKIEKCAKEGVEILQFDLSENEDFKIVIEKLSLT
jgi:death-on-curing protein